MTFYLAKTLNNIKKYGPVPDLSGEPEKVEEYNISEEENEWLLDNLVDEINARCNSLLDDGDYDYFDVEMCHALIELLEDLPKDFVPEKYESMIATLKEYAKRAIGYKTGIAIEL